MATKLLFIVPYYLPDVSFGGPVFSVSALCESLADQGMEVTVYTIGYDAAETYPQRRRLSGVDVHYFKGDMGRPCQVSYQLWHALSLHADQFDLVHLQTWWNILIFRSLLILRNRRPRVVLSPRGMMSDYSFTHRKTGLKRAFQQSLGKRLLQGVALHATSAAEAKEMAYRCNRFQDSIHVVPNLLNLQFAEEAADSPDGFRIGFLSRLHHKKGIELLLDAVAQCPFIDELVIGGRGEAEYEQLLHQRVEALGIGSRVRFAGWVEHAEKQAFFDGFHLMVLPSFNENFANVVVEAWAAGKPVIISNEVGLSDYVSRYQPGWLCEANTQSLVQALEHAFRHQHQLPAMTENALRLVQYTFSDARMVKAYQDLYERVLQEGAEEKDQLAQEPSKAAVNNNLYVLGLNAHHADASAALYQNGRLVAAAEEERFRRVKHWAGFPAKAIAYCLEEAGIDITQVQHIAIGRDSSAKLLSKAVFLLQYPDALSMALKGRLSNAGKNQSIQQAVLSMAGGDSDYQPRFIAVEHHRSHLASAFYPSPYQRAALLSVDGSGDFTTTMMGTGDGLDIQVLQTVDFPHSLGIFYTAFTQLLGFWNYGDEYKVMGLAAYGEPKYYQDMERVIEWQEEGSFRLNPNGFSPPRKGYVRYDRDHQPTIPRLFSPQLEEIFGKARQPHEPITQHHKDLAASVQKMLEETLFMLLHWLHQKTGLTDLCLAGGVAQNSAANGKILSRTPFRRVFVPPAGHDAGLAMGAALWWQHQALGLSRINSRPLSPYTGKSWSHGSIGQMLADRRVASKYYPDFDVLCNEVSACIAAGGVVGWYRGRSEFGPRALGNRSILADPRRDDARDLINEKIKRRELFRPFAPSVLADAVADWFEGADEVPYMEKVYPVQQNCRSRIPAVVHVDGTGRLQTVSKQINPDFYQLIETFNRLTGVPILLNTSFNENEPIVNTPLEALDCYLRTNMDMLVLENFIVRRG